MSPGPTLARPRTTGNTPAMAHRFDDILGQDRAVQTLQQALASGRTHHGWVFYGPEGVGKFTTALAFARVLLCPHAAADDHGQVVACGQCTSCRSVDDPETAHPDLHVVTKELAAYSSDDRVRRGKQITIPVDVIRTRLVDPAHRKSQLHHNKAFIVDEAELLALEGQNTLLKTLEEPPAGTYLVLVTANEERLLPTIRSRCQRVGFETLSDEHVQRYLRDRHEVANDRLPWLVRFARGSLGRAAMAIDYELDDWLRQIEPRVDHLAAGRADPELGPTLAKLTDDFASAWVEAHDNASKDAANKAAARTMFGMLGDICRRRLNDAAASGLPEDPEQAESQLTPWLEGVELLAEAERQLQSNVAAALLLDNLCVQWAVAAR